VPADRSSIELRHLSAPLSLGPNVEAPTEGARAPAGLTSRVSGDVGISKNAGAEVSTPQLVHPCSEDKQLGSRSSCNASPRSDTIQFDAMDLGPSGGGWAS